MSLLNTFIIYFLCGDYLDESLLLSISCTLNTFLRMTVNACILLRVQMAIIYLYEFHADFYFSMFCKKEKQREGLKKHWVALERLYADFWSTWKLKSLFWWSLGVYNRVNKVIDTSRFYEWFVHFYTDTTQT